MRNQILGFVRPAPSFPRNLNPLSRFSMRQSQCIHSAGSLIYAAKVALCCRSGSLTLLWQQQRLPRPSGWPSSWRVGRSRSLQLRWPLLWLLSSELTVRSLCAARSVPWLSPVVIAYLLCTALLYCHGCSQPGLTSHIANSPAGLSGRHLLLSCQIRLQGQFWKWPSHISSPAT